MMSQRQIQHTERMQVSVLVPIYKVEQYIERCARSLFEQTLQDIEFIFVDDCSPDNSIGVLERVIKEYPQRQVRIIKHKSNFGSSAARKTAFDNALGKYWICCDSDDWVEPNMYERMLVIAESEGADIVCCGFIEEGVSSRKIQYDYEKETQKEILDSKRFGWIYGAQWNKLIRAELIQKHHINPIEGIDMWDDSCVTLPLRLLSKKTVILKDCLYHYNIGNISSICHQVSTKKLTSQTKAIHHLEHFLAENGFKEVSTPLINSLKIEVASPLFDNFSKENILLLKSLVPDVNVWKTNQWSTKTKLGHWLILNLPITLVICLRNLKNSLKHQRY